MSSTSGFFARTVWKDARFEAESEAIYGSIENADDALRAVEFAVAREPQIMAVCVDPECNLYAIKVPQSQHARGIVVYYTFDANTVTFHSIILAND